MTPRTGQTVLPDHRHFPETVLKVLVKQAAKVTPGRIPGDDFRILPDPAACPHQAEVQLIVLVTHQRFIEHPEPF